MPKKKSQEEDDCKGSKAKKILKEMLLDERIPLDSDQMDPKTAFSQHPDFATVKYETFRDGLRCLHNKIIDDKKRAASDSEGLADFRRLFPAKEYDHRGLPRWEGSEAERLLKLDMESEDKRKMKPMDLYNSRPDYHTFYPLDIFRKHIYQEIDSRKFKQYLRDKNAKES